MNDENTIDLDPTDTVTDEIKFDGAWAELEAEDAKVLTSLVEELMGGEGGKTVTLTQAELQDTIAYAFMAGVVLEEADMMSQLFASMAEMPGMAGLLLEDDDDDGAEELFNSDEIGDGTGGSGLH